MTTFEPEISLFAAQVESLRGQSDDRWTCVISDGGSRPESLAAIREVLGDDPRFELSASTERLDPYRNFERALGHAPAGAELIALCDQDDRWYPEKLEVLRAGLGTASMVYSDQRLVTDDGRVLRDSLWEGRRNDWSNLASLLVANAVPGAAMLFRRELLELALPFPDAPVLLWHDHWLALTALAGGSIAYVDRPLYDYVQHVGAVSGDVAAGPRGRRPVAAARTGRSRLGALAARSGSRGWRGAYFGGYLPRVVQAQTLLLRCEDTLTPRKRHALELFLASADSPAAFAWLTLRPLRALTGRGETLGGETALAQGVLWRWLVAIAAGRVPSARRPAVDASFPDPPRFEQPRLRRWRARGR
jgi:O-antigen biosynthesis protein